MVKTRNRLVRFSAWFILDFALTSMFVVCVASIIVFLLDSTVGLLGAALLLSCSLILWVAYLMPNPVLTAYMPEAREKVYQALMDGSGISSVGLRLYSKQIDALIVDALCNGRLDLAPNIEDWQLDFVQNNACQLIAAWSDNTVGPNIFTSLKKFVGSNKDLQHWAATHVFDDFGYTAATYALTQAVITKSMSRVQAALLLQSDCAQDIFRAAKAEGIQGKFSIG